MKVNKKVYSAAMEINFISSSKLKTQCCRKTAQLTGQFLLYFRHASVGANCPLSPNNLKRD